MTRTLMEVDGAGSPMGSNSFFGAARDFARLGQLYLNDGVANGKRILPEGWVEYSRRQTLDTGYGAGFWLNVTDGPIKMWPGAHWGMTGAPKDTYYARGFQGQFIVIVPSENLVVVRLGVSQSIDGGVRGISDLMRDVIAALRTP
jgi:CubicO group peptidase (beta-lactamase class C family)